MLFHIHQTHSVLGFFGGFFLGGEGGFIKIPVGYKTAINVFGRNMNKKNNMRDVHK